MSAASRLYSTPLKKPTQVKVEISATNFSVAVPSIEGLKGKHAIYLIAEGPEVQQPQNNRSQFGHPQQPQRPVGLFDLHGIGFAKSNIPFEAPIVPTVNITVDGKTLNLPSTPIRCTNANGNSAYFCETDIREYPPLLFLLLFFE